MGCQQLVVSVALCEELVIATLTWIQQRSTAGSLVGVFYATPFHLVGTLRFGVALAASSKNLCFSLTLISRWFERPADGSSADLRYATSFGLVAATPFWVVLKGVRYRCCWRQRIRSRRNVSAELLFLMI
ncbi:hypothetical protein F511_19945 [Dorcoceras hygrometricum]|uniref:Uncharacterized protein n=1 Tax=Dorcoceras hygrometricum TaxID=472368 RepID=A0A2Z7C7B0_9LAMI|nr:hypothetical protein F511_19945 [Dorcoceras hygrometricum]